MSGGLGVEVAGGLGGVRRELGVSALTAVALIILKESRSHGRGAQNARRLLGVSSAPVGPKKRQNTKENKGLVHSGGAHVGNPKKFKSVPMERGARFVLHRSVPMERGARFSIFDVPMGGPTWPQ